ncbi:unnamed protein product [Vicia faba]|uniref:S-protein homolog n=1 Tax=Vicia faba TaxID=3906 RepID=A0AAV0YFD4_VICFA|nr:unnamed protein product [Vicia faba]
MTASVSKFVLLFSMLLIVLVALQFKGGESSSFQNDKVTLTITNTLQNNIQLGLHCQSKDDDLGVHTLRTSQSFAFTFRPNYFTIDTLYFCRFTWASEVHYFDVYVQRRDFESDDCRHTCDYKIKESGPCRGGGHCFPWNKNVAVEGRQFDGKKYHS